MTQDLSNREKEVVELLLQGKSNKMIALSLGITDRTVEFHLRNIYDKYQVRTRTELILLLRNSAAAPESEKLGVSTVAHPPNSGENRARFRSWKDWTAAWRETIANIGKEIKMSTAFNANTDSSNNNLTFFESIRVCLTKYADFQGRATRSEFWWFTLFVVLVASALMYLSEALGNIFLIAMLLPFVAAGTRRLRDGGNNVWWQFFLLVPVGGIIMLGFLWAQPPKNTAPGDTPPA